VAEVNIVADVTTPASERLAGVVDRIQRSIVTMHQFRPEDPAKAALFDSMISDMLSTLVQTAAAAAVDKASIILAQDLSAQRQDFMLASQKLRDQTDAAMAAQVYPFVQGLPKPTGS